MRQLYNLIWLFLFLLSACSKSGDGDTGGNGNIDDMDKEFVINKDEFPKSCMLVENFSNFYPMQVFVKSSIVDKGIFSEVNTNVRPYSLIFDFVPIPYTTEVPSPEGRLSFTKAITRTMESDEWKVYNESGATMSLHLAYAMYSSVDKAKRFLGNSSLYDLLNENDYKYTFVAKIISSKFNVITHLEGTFTDEAINDACYISSVTFGRYAYLSIQTNEAPEKILDIFKNGILKGDMSYVDKYVQISSSVNVIEKGGNATGGYWGANGFYKLVETFNPNTRYVGVPILFQFKDVKSGEVVNPYGL